MEDIMGIRNTAIMMNHHERDELHGLVDRNAAVNTFDHMNSKLASIESYTNVTLQIMCGN